MFSRCSRVPLVPFDSRCTNVRILGLPAGPIVEVLHGLRDGLVQPPRWALRKLLTRLHEVMEDPGSLGLAHLIFGCEVPELPGDERVDLAFFELLGPAREVIRRG